MTLTAAGAVRRTSGGQTSGDGLVSPYTVPHLNHFLLDPAIAATDAARGAGPGGEAERRAAGGGGGDVYAEPHRYAVMQDFLGEVRPADTRRARRPPRPPQPVCPPHGATCARWRPLM